MSQGSRQNAPAWRGSYVYRRSTAMLVSPRRCWRLSRRLKMKHRGKGSRSVVVVGAGIAGLASAFMIREYAGDAGESVDITILEADDRHGGATRTDHADGYTCEWGPNGFLDNEPATLELVKRLGIESELMKADESAANRYIYHGGAMRKVPMKPPQFLVSDILPLSAKLRMAMEFVIPAKHNGAEETVDQFGRRRLGRSFASTMLDPMVSGIFAGNTKELSLGAVFPKMVAMEREYGGLFRAMFAKQKEAKRSGTKSGGPAGPSAVLHTFRDGMGRLPDAIADEFQGSIRLGARVTGLVPREGGAGFMIHTEKDRFEADEVVLACPSHAAAEIVQDLDGRTAEALRAIWHAPVDVVCHGHHPDEIAHPLNGFGVLIPRSEGIRSLGTLWSDSIFPGQAPGDRKLLRTILGGAHDPGIANLSVDRLHDTAHRDHRTVMGVREEPRFRTEFRHPHGIAQYTLGHLARVAETERLEYDLPGLHFTGASYRGVSVNGCAKDAFRVAGNVWKREEATV
ncbi:protoporphyrinogen oxidase [bacterium]|nr:protoporphyrinogen oxidase [bacterium]